MRRRRHEALEYDGRHFMVLVDRAIGKLDFQHLETGIIANRSDVAGANWSSLHLALPAATDPTGDLENAKQQQASCSLQRP